MSKTVSYTNVHLSYTADLQGLRQAKSDMAAMNRVINQTKTDTQKYEEHVQKLDRLLHNGKISQEQYNQAVAAARTKFLGAAQAAASYRETVSSLGDAMLAAGGVAAVGLATGAGMNQVRESVRAYADLESTMTTLEVVYGDAGRAARDFAKFREMAAVSPLETKDFTRAAQALAQYGVETDKIVMHLDRLSEISSGNAERMQSLSLAFAQVKANGRLMGQEVLQMVNAGFNPLAEISRTTGRSMQDLRKDMENGSVSFEMVANALKTATDEGGRFYNMNEKLATTVNARFAQMRDEVTKTREALGELFAAATPFESMLQSLQGATLFSSRLKNDFMNMNAAEAAMRIGGAGSFSDVSMTDLRTMLGIGGKAGTTKTDQEIEAAKNRLGGMLGSAISSIPSQIESAGTSYADSMRSMTDVLRRHSQEITQTTVKQRAAEIERMKRDQAEKQQVAKEGGADSAINTGLPKAISMATKEGYEYIRNAQQGAQQKQLEEQRRQRQAQEEANKILEQIKNKPAMGIVK